jgi:type III pantothenate kinase
MILLVDIGNSRLKWATLEDEVFTFCGIIDYRNQDFEQSLQMAWGALPMPTCVRVANVAGDAIAKKLKQWLKQTWSCPVEFLSATAKALGVSNAYHHPEKLGVDRWLSLLAARQQFSGKPFVLFGCGTCITVDALTSDGTHLGGLIAPGIGLMQRSIMQATAVPDQEMHQAAELDLATDTQTAMANGALTMAAAFIEYTAEKLRAQLGDELICILTGGSAARLHQVLSKHYHHQPHLVLKGLAAIVS